CSSGRSSPAGSMRAACASPPVPAAACPAAACPASPCGACFVSLLPSLVTPGRSLACRLSLVACRLSIRSDRGHPAVHREDLAGDVLAGIRAEQHRGALQVLVVAQPAQRRARLDVLADLVQR